MQLNPSITDKPNSGWHWVKQLWRVSLPAAVIISAAIYMLTRWEIGDPDYYWHLATGRWIFEHGQLPVNDPFLWTQENTRWVLHEWLFEVVLWAVYLIGEHKAVGIFVSLCFGIFLAVVYRFCRQFSPPIFCLVLTLLVTMVSAAWVSGRPQILTYTIFAIFLFCLLRYCQTFDRKFLFLLPPLMLFWTNLHGAYTIGLGLFIAFLGSFWIDQCTDQKRIVILEFFQRTKSLWMFFLFCLVAAVINPYFVEHLIYPFKVISLGVLPFISEWQPLTIKSAGAAGLFSLAIIYGFILTDRGQRPTFTEFGVPLFFLLMALLQHRHAPLAAITFAVFCAWLWPQTRLAQQIRNAKAQAPESIGAKDLGSIEYVLNIGVVVLALIWVVLDYDNSLQKRLNAREPLLGRTATDYLYKEGFSGRLYNEYGAGGYVSYRLYPRSKAFIDGRSDMYSFEFFEDARNLSAGKEGLIPLLDKYQFDAMIVSKESPLARVLPLLSTRYKIVKTTEHHLVYRR